MGDRARFVPSIIDDILSGINKTGKFSNLNFVENKAFSCFYIVILANFCVFNWNDSQK